jgi:hypothetical protein
MQEPSHDRVSVYRGGLPVPRGGAAGWRTSGATETSRVLSLVSAVELPETKTEAPGWPVDAGGGDGGAWHCQLNSDQRSPRWVVKRS